MNVQLHQTDDHLLAQKEAASGGGDHSAAASEDEKADDAVDYSDEEDMADDDSAPLPQASKPITTLPGCALENPVHLPNRPHPRHGFVQAMVPSQFKMKASAVHNLSLQSWLFN